MVAYSFIDNQYCRGNPSWLPIAYYFKADYSKAYIKLLGFSTTPMTYSLLDYQEGILEGLPRGDYTFNAALVKEKEHLFNPMASCSDLSE